MSKTLSHADIRNLLEGFAAAIDFDQRRVDAMPTCKFNIRYCDDMWRRWRAGHIAYINSLLQTVDEISPAMLNGLTDLKMDCNAEVVQEAFIELFAEAVSNSCTEEELGTAERLFGWLVCEVHKKSAVNPRLPEKTSDLMWWNLTDPLKIAQDPEAGYSLMGQICDDRHN
jgi:hypothetical protein